MRISDWSSDVCSSDLRCAALEVDEWKAASKDGQWGGLQPLCRRRRPTVQPVAGDRSCQIETFAREPANGEDRKSVVSGKSVSVRVDLGGRRIIKKKKLMTLINTVSEHRNTKT